MGTAKHELVARAEAQLAEIRQKTLQLASNAWLAAEALESERAEESSLEQEATKLEAGLSASNASLEVLQMRACEHAAETVQRLVMLHDEWRQHHCATRARVCALACSLAILEKEANAIKGPLQQ